MRRLYSVCWQLPICRPHATASLPDDIPDPHACLAILPAQSAILGDVELCLAWRLSYTIQQHTTRTVALAYLASLRAAYLDELERRNPSGVNHWLHHGARAAGDPSRYLTRRRPTASNDH